MFRTITTSPSNWLDNDLPEEAMAEIQAELDRLKLLGKTDGIQLRLGKTTELYRSGRFWYSKESAEQWIVFITNLHTKYSLPPLIEAEVKDVS